MAEFIKIGNQRFSASSITSVSEGSGGRVSVQFAPGHYEIVEGDEGQAVLAWADAHLVGGITERRPPAPAPVVTKGPSEKKEK